MAAGFVGREPQFPVQKYRTLESANICLLCNVSHLPPLCDHSQWQYQWDDPQAPYATLPSRQTIGQVQATHSSHLSPNIESNIPSLTHDQPHGPTNAWTSNRKEDHSPIERSAPSGTRKIPSLLSPFQYQPPKKERRQTASNIPATRRLMTQTNDVPPLPEYPERGSSLPHRRLSFMSFASLEPEDPLSPQELLNGYHCDHLEPKIKATCKKWVEDVEKARSDRSCHSEPNRPKSRIWLDLTEDLNGIDDVAKVSGPLESGRKDDKQAENDVGLTAKAITIKSSPDRPRMTLLRPRAATSPNIPTIKRPDPTIAEAEHIPVPTHHPPDGTFTIGDIQFSNDDSPLTGDDTLYSDGLGITSAEPPSVPLSKTAREQEVFNRIKSRPTFKPDSRIRRTLSRVNLKAATTIWCKDPPSHQVATPNIPNDPLPTAQDTASSTTIDSAASSPSSLPTLVNKNDTILTALESLLPAAPPSVPFKPTLHPIHPIISLLKLPSTSPSSTPPHSLQALHRIFATSSHPHLIPPTDSLHATLLALNFVDNITFTPSPQGSYKHSNGDRKYAPPRAQAQAQVHRTDVPPKARAMLGMVSPPPCRPGLPGGWLGGGTRCVGSGAGSVVDGKGVMDDGSDQRRKVNQQRREWQARVRRVRKCLEGEREALWGSLFADDGSDGELDENERGRGDGGEYGKERKVLGRALGEVVRFDERKEEDAEKRVKP